MKSLAQLSKSLLVLIPIGLSLASCHSGPKTMKSMAEEMVSTYSGSDGLAGLNVDVAEEQEEHINAARTAVEENSLVTADDHLYAGYILMHSSMLADVALARELCSDASEMGHAKGLMMAAVATDDWLFLQGLPQRYGTKFVYEPFTERWRMYAVDPITKDAERHAMGIPSLADLKAELETRNKSGLTKTLRKSGMIGQSAPVPMERD